MNANAPVKINRPLHWFAVATAIATFLLLGAGGLVTSHEAGMSVPDWPNSYGYNMFLFPWDQWVIFLHPTQRSVVERSFNGPARVTGSAGTGKSVVALHRAAWRATTPD